MRGKIHAQAEATVELAWHIENFSRAGKRLKPLQHYLDRMRPRPLQSPDQVIALFEGFAERGLATIAIREKD